MSDAGPARDPMVELRYALAEATAVPAPGRLRRRVLEAAIGRRPSGTPAEPAAHISGAEAFRRAVSRLAALLEELEPAEWSLPALRDLDVQGLIGHLIGVEAGFLALLSGDEDAVLAGSHVVSTQASALAQGGRSVLDTRTEWVALAARTCGAIAAAGEGVRRWYGIEMPLDQLLVVRAFELWIHEEDIRRAAHRPLVDPDPESLARMTGLAVNILPGYGLAGSALEGQVRLVLTGPAGGTWDLTGASLPPGDERAESTRVVVGAAEFCRIVANRLDADAAAPTVSGSAAEAASLFAAARALALD